MFSREDVPVAVGLVVDNSGSMRSKLPEVLAAASAFAKSSNAANQMFVANFNERVSMGLPQEEAFTNSLAELKIQARGETALYDAIAAALAHIRQSPLPKKVLIVVSDGGDNASKRRFPEELAMVQQSEAIVYTVGIFDEYDLERYPAVLRQLAQVSGGETFFQKEVSDVTSVLQSVSRDIRNQYTIGYVPKNERREGNYRSVRVSITAHRSSGRTVRTRKGYFATPLNAPVVSQGKAK